MTKHFTFPLLALAVTTLALAGCSSDDSDEGGSGGTAATGGAAGTGGAPTVAYSGTAKSLKPPPAGSGNWTEEGAIAGAEICLDGSSTLCATSAADGAYTLGGAPANSEIALAITRADYPRFLLQYVTTTEDVAQDLNLLTTTALNQHLAGSGCSWPPPAGTGFIYIGAPAGSKVALVQSPSSQAVYAGDDGFDPSFTEIPPNTLMSRAEAVFCSVAPGTYDVEVTQTSGACHRIEGWPSEKHAAKIVVQADTLSVFNWVCL